METAEGSSGPGTARRGLEPSAPLRPDTFGKRRAGPAGRASAASPGDGSRVAAFFDVDNTIVRGASAYHLARELYRREFFGIRDIAFFAGHSVAYFLFGENTRRIAAVRARALGIAQGRTIAEVVAIGEHVYDEVLSTRIFPGARALIDGHRAAGDEVWFITASPVEIGEMLARRLGATGSLGTIAESRDGVYTGELHGSMLHGEGKKNAAHRLARERGIDLSRSFAYGDSANDIPILSAVGHACAINPEPRLRLHAAEAGWPVRDFRRRRPSMRRRVARGLRGAGAIWAATVTVRAVWRQLTGGH